MDWPPPEEEPEIRYHRVALAAELREGRPVIARVGVKRLALVRLAGTLYAVSNTCPHAGGSLGLGRVEGRTLVCPRHGWAFDVSTGVCPHHDIYRVTTYPIEVRNGEVWVGIREERW